MSTVNLLVAMGMLLAVTQIVHVIVWRVKRPQHYLIWFSIWWLAVPGAVLFVALVILPFVAGQPLDWTMIAFWFAAYTGYLAFCGAYVHLFPAISTSSPSLEILWTLSRRPGHVAQVDDLRVPTGSSSKLIERRIDNEVINGFLKVEGDALVLTPRARPFVKLVSAFRRLLGIRDDLAG